MNNNPIKKILLVDGNNYLYRIYFALQRILKDQKKDNNNLVLHSLIFNLEKLLKNLKIDYCFFAFDFKKKTFRNDLYEDYKKDRPKMPENLYQNMQIFEEYLNTRNISVNKEDGYEADDVIASLVNKFLDENIIFYILSSDLDICQLIKENVIYLNISNKILYPDFWTTEKFFEKFSFLPNQIIDFKAIVGDSSDNIKGIPKIGKVTATKLLKKFSTIENVFKNIDELDKKLKEIFLLEETKNNLNNNKKLIKLIDNLYLQKNISLKNHIINKKLIEFLDKYKLIKIKNFLESSICNKE